MEVGIGVGEGVGVIEDEGPVTGGVLDELDGDGLGLGIVAGNGVGEGENEVEGGCVVVIRVGAVEVGAEGSVCAEEQPARTAVITNMPTRRVVFINFALVAVIFSP